MKRELLAALLVLGTAGHIAPTSAVADEPEESAFAVDFAVDFYSDYMFRGQNLYPGTSIQPSIAPSISLGDLGNLSALTWFHFSGDGRTNGVDEFFEYDQTFSYDYTYDLVTLSVGHVWYTYPEDEIATTAEIIGTVSVDTVLSPTLAFYHDYREFDSEYYELTLSHKFSFEKAVDSVTPFVNVGFATNAEKIYGEDDGYVQTTFGVSAEVPLGPVVVQPRIAYTDGDAQLTVDEFFMGFSVVYSL